MKLNFVILIAALIVCCFSCEKTNKYPERKNAVLPDVPINFEAMNSPFDDYNMASPIEGETSPLCFSTNRNSNGNNFDIIYKLADTYFNVYNGKWTFGENTSANLNVYRANVNIKSALSLINTNANELGPFLIPKGPGSYWNGTGYDRFQNWIFLYATDVGGQLDIKFTHNLTNNAYIPPQPVSFLNSDKNDAYPSITADSSTVYFCSDRGGNFDIYKAALPGNGDLITRLSATDNIPIKKETTLSSAFDDKCPFIFGDMLVFASNRPGGYGGYDLYYSILQNDTWSEPVNFGEKINTKYDEYRPIVKNLYFINNMMLFSSNRIGGKGGFDLYYVGIDRKVSGNK